MHWRYSTLQKHCLSFRCPHSQLKSYKTKINLFPFISRDILGKYELMYLTLNKKFQRKVQDSERERERRWNSLNPKIKAYLYLKDIHQGDKRRVERIKGTRLLSYIR